MHIEEFCKQSAGPRSQFLIEMDVFECVVHLKKLGVEGIISSRLKFVSD